VRAVLLYRYFGLAMRADVFIAYFYRRLVLVFFFFLIFSHVYPPYTNRFTGQLRDLAVQLDVKLVPVYTSFAFRAIFVKRNFGMAFRTVILTVYLADAVDFVFGTDFIRLHFKPPSPSITQAGIDILTNGE
jgi:hypothetical protein